MKCPHCVEAVLLMTDRQGVGIDYCPQCQGVWLDRGELDKLLERAADAAPVAPVASPMQAMPTAPHDASGYKGDGRDGRDGYRRSDSDYRKKKSWLNEIFD